MTYRKYSCPLCSIALRRALLDVFPPRKILSFSLSVSPSRISSHVNFHDTVSNTSASNIDCNKSSTTVRPNSSIDTISCCAEVDTTHCEGVEKGGNENTEPQEVEKPSDYILVMIDGVRTNEEKNGRG